MILAGQSEATNPDAPLRQLLQLACGHDEGHPVEALLQLVFTRIRFVVDQIVIFIFIVSVLVDLGHDGELVGMIEIEEQLDTPPPRWGQNKLSEFCGVLPDRDRCADVAALRLSASSAMRAATVVTSSGGRRISNYGLAA
jgi:hypothetical protein